MTATVNLKLYPKLDISNLPKKLAGKTVNEATEIMKSTSNVTGVEFEINVPVEFLKSSLPVNSQKISVQVQAIKTDVTF